MIWSPFRKRSPLGKRSPEDSASGNTDAYNASRVERECDYGACAAPVDFHSHMLPGLDDGSPDWETTLRMARAACEAGIRVIVLTPHFITGVYESPRERVLELVHRLRSRLTDEAVELEVLPGSEVHLTPEVPGLLRSGTLVTLGDRFTHLLVEFPAFEVPPWAEGVLFELMLQGITPVIAHPERNSVLSADVDRLRRVVERGALCQVNAGSFLGAYGSGARACAVKLVRAGLAHFLGSDAHSPRGIGVFVEAVNVLQRLDGGPDFLAGGSERATEILGLSPKFKGGTGGYSGGISAPG